MFPPRSRSEWHGLDGGRKEVESKRKILLTFFDRLISETPSQNDALVAIVPTKRSLSSRLKSALRLDIFPGIFLSGNQILPRSSKELADLLTALCNYCAGASLEKH